MLYIYYSNEEYETGKHKILSVYSDRVQGPSPEESSSTLDKYTVIEIEERYNPKWYMLYGAQGERALNDLPMGFYVNNAGQIVNDDTQRVFTIEPNPQRESYKLSQLYGLTQAQLETYIENNVTNLVEAKTFLKKLSAVVLWLVKQSRLDE